MKTLLAAVTAPDIVPVPAARLIVFPGADAPSVRARKADAFLEQAAAYARRSGAYLVPGLYVKDEALCLSLLDPDGHVLLEQQAAHLNPSWAGNLKRGDEITVAETVFGKVALVPDVDVYKGEVLRICALQGAEIVVSVQVIPERDYSREMILAGAWQQAQQNCLYLLNATNINGSIIGPCDTTADHSGFLAEISDAYPLQAELSSEKRLAAYKTFPVFKSLNPRLYRNHLEELCK
jgi:predicted amidohydrolase